EGVDAFFLDIDVVVAYPPVGERPLDLAEHPRVRAVVERLDGELLDEVGRLWYRGKGWPDPAEQRRAAKEIVLQGWRPGMSVSYNNVLEGLRQDLYEIGDRLYEATDVHCISPGCTCGEVAIEVDTRAPRGAAPLGQVIVERSGAVRMESEKGAGTRLAQIW